MQDSAHSSNQVGELNPDNDSELAPNPPAPTKRMAKQLVKTRFCKHFLRGFCRYQDKCGYAHYNEELMPRPNLAKTKICVSFLAGNCQNEACNYAHGLNELRQADPLSEIEDMQQTHPQRVDIASQQEMMGHAGHELLGHQAPELATFNRPPLHDRQLFQAPEPPLAQQPHSLHLQQQQLQKSLEHLAALQQQQQLQQLQQQQLQQQQLQQQQLQQLQLQEQQQRQQQVQQHQLQQQQIQQQNQLQQQQIQQQQIQQQQRQQQMLQQQKQQQHQQQEQQQLLQNLAALDRQPATQQPQFGQPFPSQVLPLHAQQLPSSLSQLLPDPLPPPLHGALPGAPPQGPLVGPTTVATSSLGQPSWQSAPLLTDARADSISTQLQVPLGPSDLLGPMSSGRVPSQESLASLHQAVQLASDESASRRDSLFETGQRPDGDLMQSLLTPEAMRLLQAGDGPPLQSEDDSGLFQEVVSEIFQLLLEEEQREASKVPAPSWPSMRWASISMHLLQWKFRTTLLEGKCLLSHSKTESLTLAEEQMAEYIFLSRPSWVGDFPGLAKRCSQLIAQRLSSLGEQAHLR